MSAMAAKVAFFTGPEHQPFQLGQGPTGVLLIHGFPGTPAEMRPLGERLATAGHAAHGLLLPGFGPDIVRLGEVSSEDWLAAARAAWRDLRAAHQTAVLIGYSMGGALALRLAADDPPDGLVLLAPFWRLGGCLLRLLPLLKHVFRNVAPFRRADFNSPGVRRQLEALLPDADLDDPQVQQYLREQVRLPLSAIDDLRRLGQSARAFAPRVAGPALVLQGDADTTVPPAATRQLVSQMGRSVTYREVPGTHRFVRLEPGGYDYSSDVLAFIQQVTHTAERTNR